MEAAKRAWQVLLAPAIAVGSAYSAAARARPVATAVSTAGVQTWMADGIAQLVVEKRDTLDRRRSALFATFGVMYIGGFQYLLYSVAFVRWSRFFETVGSASGLGAPVTRALVDQLGHVPAIYFPSFYALKAVVEGRPLAGGDEGAIGRYRAEGWECLKANWSIWIPAQIINFTFVPAHLRIPFVSTTSFGWTVVLSAMQSAFDRGRSPDTCEREQA